MARNIPVRSLVCLRNKDIFSYFGSFPVDSGCFQLTSTTSTTFLPVELVVVKHGCHLFSCLYRQPRVVLYQGLYQGYTDTCRQAGNNVVIIGALAVAWWYVLRNAPIYLIFGFGTDIW